jgi:dihydropteroate synthase
MKVMNCNGKTLDLSTPKIMGILNVTPDSFYDGGRHNKLSSAVDQAGKMIQDGASIIDIGGMSSRPGAPIIDPEIERKRVLPIVKEVRKLHPDVIISVDTLRSEIAKSCIDAGADMINDISAGNFDPKMIQLVADTGVPYLMMHMQGIPENMQDAPVYSNIIEQIIQYFILKIEECRSKGIEDLIIDPGFGFGKSLDDNYKILANLNLFNILDLPVLAGISRKSMIYKLINKNPEEAIFGTTAAHMLALQNGASILRVHDVSAAFDTILVWQFTNEIK